MVNAACDAELELMGYLSNVRPCALPTYTMPRTLCIPPPTGALSGLGQLQLPAAYAYTTTCNNNNGCLYSPTISYFCPPAISTTPLGGGETEAPVSESSELKRAVPVSEVNPKKRAPGMQHSSRKLFLNEFCPRQAEGHRKCSFCQKALGTPLA